MGQIIRPEWNVSDFLQAYPRMAIAPIEGGRLVLTGDFDFAAEFKLRSLVDSYALRILVPTTFPKQVPTVFEIAGRIPKNGNHHVFEDQSLCLGSPLRLSLMLQDEPTLMGFASRCLIPYLFSMSCKLKGGGFIFGELAHGAAGLMDDYKSLFGLQDNAQVAAAIACLKLKKRPANKQRCPCGCGNRLGVCKFNRRINALRSRLGSARRRI